MLESRVLDEKQNQSPAKKKMPDLPAKQLKKGKTPLTTKTAKNNPQVKKNFLNLSGKVFKTCAFIIALSTLEIISKRQSPKTTIII